MKKYFSFIFVILLVFFVLFSILFVKFEPEYSSAISENMLVKNENNTFDFFSQNPQNIWYIGVKKDFIDKNFSHPGSFCARFFVQNSTFEECLDIEQGDATEEYYSFPIITALSRTASVEILYNHSHINDISSIKLYSMNTLPIGKKLVFSFQKAIADTNIISRAGWGADETLRYTSHYKHILREQKLAKDILKPKTELQIKQEQKNADAHNMIKEKLGSDFITTSLIRVENGNKLVWPIQKVKKVNKIIIHHTADKLDGRSDEELLRAIYAYHSVTRGWGDIGYNFIVGQNGKIYEGRAGGDYVVAAHALYNNIGSVGISVLGDYESSHLNLSQEYALKSLIDTVARKYGINVNTNVMSFRPCRSGNCYPVEVHYTKALIGHKDVGITNCPGKNIYKFLPSWRKELSHGYLPVYNTEIGVIESNLPISEGIQIKNNTSSKNISLSGASIPTLISPKNIPFDINNNTFIAPKDNTQNQSKVLGDETIRLKNVQNILELAKNEKYFGKKFRVKLSYPEEKVDISLRGFQNTPATIFLDYIRSSLFESDSVNVTLKGKDALLVTINGKTQEVKRFSLSAGVVEIFSWTRIPSWDTKKQYNDNVFRDTIEVFNENGKLVVVNHLPLEYYLKGLGEVSDSDLPEKIKTITVAARGYASFYSQWENRKYGTQRYDGNDDPDSFQNYIGFSYEMRSPNVSKMVDATEGEKIYFQEKLIKPWYFSRSNGRTLSFLEYCHMNKGKDCQDIPYLQSIVDHAGEGMIRSGHGVGISGIGATDFAKKGWNYRQIIEYYLPGVEIKK